LDDNLGKRSADLDTKLSIVRNFEFNDLVSTCW